jgi:hypothetical protein
MTEQAGVVIPSRFVFGKFSVRISANLTEVFHDFPWSFQANVRLAPRLGHNPFLSKLFSDLLSKILTVFQNKTQNEKKNTRWYMKKMT